jgi:protein-S-isoprenylcysteine O-methyltransferase Ste14
MSTRMSRWGVGPLFAAWALAGVAAATVADTVLGNAFTIPWLPAPVRMVLGAALIVWGVAFYAAAAVTVMRAYNADTLLTHGVYARCRHPVYAAWAVFILPGAFIVGNCWLGLVLSFGLCRLVPALAVKEDEYLEERFGEAFRTYRKRVPAVLPFGMSGSRPDVRRG